MYLSTYEKFQRREYRKTLMITISVMLLIGSSFIACAYAVYEGNAIVAKAKASADSISMQVFLMKLAIQERADHLSEYAQVGADVTVHRDKFSIVVRDTNVLLIVTGTITRNDNGWTVTNLKRIKHIH